MRIRIVLLFFCLIQAELAFAHFSHYEENEVKERVEGMNCLFQPRYDRVVSAYLQGYLVRNRSRTEQMLGKSVLYFPLFEKKLEAHQLPQELKYLPIVESALNPEAVSSAGASGLWQFMPETGKYFGLRIDLEVDERYDPERSTEAAMRYLSRLYDRFGSWELALAAYNSGGGRVSRAIRRGRSTDYWQIRRYLPRETRNYVPAFIAASYLSKFYDAHQLDPFYPQLDLQLTENIQMFEELSFHRVAQVTGLSIQTISDLNPSFTDGYIPVNTRGYQLVVPRRVAPAVRDFLKIRRQHPNAEAFLDQPAGSKHIQLGAGKQKYQRIAYQVQAGDRLEVIAREHDCTVHHLLAWNRLKTGVVEPGQSLIIYQPAEFLRFLPELLGPLEMLAPKKQPLLLGDKDPLANRQPMIQLHRKGKFWWYYPTAGESWEKIAEKFPNLSLTELWEINKENPKHLRKPGTRVRIRKAK